MDAARAISATPAPRAASVDPIGGGHFAGAASMLGDDHVFVRYADRVVLPHLSVELPSSFGATVLAAQSLMLAFAIVGPKLRNARAASRAVEGMKSACTIALSDWQEVQKSTERTRAVLTGSVEGARTQLDDVADLRAALHSFDEALRRGATSKASVERAVVELKKHASLLEIAYPAWRKSVGELEATTAKLGADVATVQQQVAEGLAEIDRLFLEGQALAAQGMYPYVEHDDTRELAGRGTDEWLARLPKDDWSNAIDPDEDKQVRWTAEGWVEPG